MSGVPTIHHPLADIDSGPGNIHLVIDINYLIDRAAVNSHPYLDMRLTMQCLTDFQGATHRLFRAAEKKQHHPVPSWQTNQFSTGFRFPETFCSANNWIEPLHQFNLLVDQQFRIPDYVDEQEMCDLEREIRFILSGYVLLGQGTSFASAVAPLFYCLRLGVMLVREHGVEIEIVSGS